MFTTVKNAFKIKEIRNKVFFTFLMLVVIRLGSQLPVPGVDRHYFSNWFTFFTMPLSINVSTSTVAPLSNTSRALTLTATISFAL